MKCTAKKVGLSSEKLETLVVKVIASRGGVAAMSDIMAAVNRAMSPHALSPVGAAGVRCLVNREMVRKGLVMLAHGVDDDGREQTAWVVRGDGDRARKTRGEEAREPPPVIVALPRASASTDPLIEKITVDAASIARKRFLRSADGAVTRRYAGGYIDEDDVAQEAAIRAFLAAKNYDERRGKPAALSQLVAKCTVKDMRRRAVSGKRAATFVDGDAFEAIAYGLSPEESSAAVVDESAVSLGACPGDGIDAHRAAVRVISSVGASASAALQRWWSEGADGPQDKLPGEARLKDALCAARRVVREQGTEVFA